MFDQPDPQRAAHLVLLKPLARLKVSYAISNI
jgi:hypothetical protein